VPDGQGVTAGEPVQVLVTNPALLG
jgi:hypothetical protein